MRFDSRSLCRGTSGVTGHTCDDCEVGVRVPWSLPHVQLTGENSMIVRVNDAGTEVQIIPNTHRDTMDLTSVLYRIGTGDCKLVFDHPLNPDDKPMIRLIPVVGNEN